MAGVEEDSESDVEDSDSSVSSVEDDSTNQNEKSGLGEESEIKNEALEEEQKVQNWLSVVSRNVLIDYWKTLGKARENATDQVQTESDFFGEAATQCVTNMIAEMPSEYGEPLQLSEIEGMKQKDVAKRLGLSISGVKSRIQRGRKLLRKSITTCCHIELNRRNELVDGECRNSNCDCSQ